jgi:hypothetical protein
MAIARSVITLAGNQPQERETMGQKFASIARAATLASAALIASPVARADGPDVKLSKEELASLLPGTKAVYVIKAGSTHRWTNEPDGKFIASTDGKTVSMAATGRYSGTAKGTWRISDDGKYCVNIDWKNATEDWCQFMFRAEDGSYYMTGSGKPEAERRKIELSK